MEQREAFLSASAVELSPEVSNLYFSKLLESLPALRDIISKQGIIQGYNEISSGDTLLSWQGQEALSVIKENSKIQSPAIEVAGPTVEEYSYGSMKDFYSFDSIKLRQQAHVSNIENMPGVTFQADGRAMPLADGSIRALFSSGLPFIQQPENYLQFFKEARRILQDNGLLFVQKLSPENLIQAVKEAQFRLLLLEAKIIINTKSDLDFIWVSGAVLQK